MSTIDKAMHSRYGWRVNHLEYMAKIGRVGGRKRKEHPRKSELAKRAANTRWQQAKRLSKHDECQSCETAENKV